MPINVNPGAALTYTDATTPTAVYSAAEIDAKFAALPPPSTGGGTPPPATSEGGTVDLDSFTGANDDAKLSAALSYAAAQSHIPAVRFAARTHNFSQAARVPFNGMKLIGPTGCVGPKNLDVSGKIPNHVILLSVGSDAQAWFVGSNDTYNVYVDGLAVQGANTSSQFWHHTGGTLYACEFSSLNFYGLAHGFGSAGTKCNVTQVTFSGHWEVIGGRGTQFYLGGSDNCLWMAGYCNFGNGGNVTADKYMAKFDTLAKSSIGYLYCTLMGGWSGLLLSGSNSYGASSFHGGTYEGINAGSAAATASPITVNGGDWSFHGGAFNYTKTAQGVIVQSGGRIAMFGPSYTPAQSPASPLIYQTGGAAAVYSPQSAAGPVPVRWNDGTMPMIPFNGVGYSP